MQPAMINTERHNRLIVRDRVFFVKRLDRFDPRARLEGDELERMPIGAVVTSLTLPSGQAEQE